MKLEICDVSKQYKDKCAVDHAKPDTDTGSLGTSGSKWCGQDDAYADDRWDYEADWRRDPLRRDRDRHNGRKIQRYLRISAAGIRILSGILGTGLSGIYGCIKRNRQKRDKRKDTGTSGIGITYGCQKEENQQNYPAE